MAKIHNLKELNELKIDLQLKDQIYFITKNDIIEYEIIEGQVANLSKLFLYYKKDSNSYIFNYLDLNKNKKYQLATKCYGYTTYRGDWPACHINDFVGLKKLIQEIYKMLENDSIEANKEELIVSRFEILDL